MTDVLDSAIDDELRAFFADARVRAGEFGAHYAALWESLEQQSSGGKRIRPRLVNAAYTGLGGTDRALARRVAVAFELLHTAFLIHDDVIDRDTVRRGAPNIAARFAGRARAHGADDRASEVWGETAAVLAGDLALSRAHREIATLPVAAECRAELLDILDRAVFVSAAGELADVVHAGSAEPPDDRSGAGDARAEDRRVLVRVSAHRGRGPRRREPGGGRRARAVRSTRGRRLPDHR